MSDVLFVYVQKIFKRTEQKQNKTKRTEKWTWGSSGIVFMYQTSQE